MFSFKRQIADIWENLTSNYLIGHTSSSTYYSFSQISIQMASGSNRATNSDGITYSDSGTRYEEDATYSSISASVYFFQDQLEWGQTFMMSSVSSESHFFSEEGAAGTDTNISSTSTSSSTSGSNGSSGGGHFYDGVSDVTRQDSTTTTVAFAAITGSTYNYTRTLTYNTISSYTFASDTRIISSTVLAVSSTTSGDGIAQSYVTVEITTVGATLVTIHEQAFTRTRDGVTDTIQDRNYNTIYVPHPGEVLYVASLGAKGLYDPLVQGYYTDGEVTIFQSDYVVGQNDTWRSYLARPSEDFITVTKTISDTTTDWNYSFSNSSVEMNYETLRQFSFGNFAIDSASTSVDLPATGFSSSSSSTATQSFRGEPLLVNDTSSGNVSTDGLSFVKSTVFPYYSNEFLAVEPYQTTDTTRVIRSAVPHTYYSETEYSSLTRYADSGATFTDTQTVITGGATTPSSIAGNGATTRFHSEYSSGVTQEVAITQFSAIWDPHSVHLDQGARPIVIVPSNAHAMYAFNTAGEPANVGRALYLVGMPDFIFFLDYDFWAVPYVSGWYFDSGENTIYARWSSGTDIFDYTEGSATVTRDRYNNSGLETKMDVKFYTGTDATDSVTGKITLGIDHMSALEDITFHDIRSAENVILSYGGRQVNSVDDQTVWAYPGFLKQTYCASDGSFSASTIREMLYDSNWDLPAETFIPDERLVVETVLPVLRIDDYNGAGANPRPCVSAYPKFGNPHEV